MLQWDDDPRVRLNRLLADFKDVDDSPAPRVPDRPLTWRDGLRIAGEALLLFALFAVLFVLLPLAVQ